MNPDHRSIRHRFNKCLVLSSRPVPYFVLKFELETELSFSLFKFELAI